MKQAILLATAALAIGLTTSCGRHDANTAPGADAVKTYVPNTGITHNAGRIVSGNYSKPISLDTANRMISSFVQSVGYPIVDTAVRSVSFDADTLRAYLANQDITAVKFYFAHQLSYLNSGLNNYGKNIGMKPGALTIICVGVNDNGGVVKNTSNGVYEHAMPCPNNCGLEVDGWLH